jgi:hypothetical protein
VDAKAQFRSLAEPWADSTSSTGRLMLAVLGGLADVERDLIRTRTAEGEDIWTFRSMLTVGTKSAFGVGNVSKIKEVCRPEALTYELFMNQSMVINLTQA